MNAMETVSQIPVRGSGNYEATARFLPGILLILIDNEDRPSFRLELEIPQPILECYLQNLRELDNDSDHDR